MNFIDYFTDPVLRAPTIGSMLMCLSSSLVGVVAFVRRKSLVGEAISHACYPGVVLAVFLLSFFFSFSEETIEIAIVAGALIFAMLALFTLQGLEKIRIKSDAALCLVLASFFGIGLLLASHVQMTHTAWYRQIQIFLFGQAATMTDSYIFLYACLSILTLTLLILFYPLIQIVSFDRSFAKTTHSPISFIDGLIALLLAISIVIGIRSVGVVLMSAMLISPAAAARQFTNRFSMLFVLAGFFGILSGFLGNYLSLEIPLIVGGGERSFSLPTGPMIVLSASLFCSLALFFAPRKSLVGRYWRYRRFQNRSLQENILKFFWIQGETGVLSVEEILSIDHLSKIRTMSLLRKMCAQGNLERCGLHLYRLTKQGWEYATRIVRVHRLWEAYLVYLGQRKEKVHMSAEEMEHWITPEIEEELTALLNNPSQDPHAKPIPKKI